MPDDFAYAPACGPAGTGATGNRLTAMTNFLGSIRAFYDCPASPQAEGRESYRAGFTPQSNEVLRLTWQLQIGAVTPGTIGGVIVQLPIFGNDESMVMGFIDGGEIVAVTNVFSSPADFVTIGDWSSLVETVMTNELEINYPQQTITLSVNGNFIATWPMRPDLTDYVDSINFEFDEVTEYGSAGNTFALDEIRVASECIFGPQVQSTNTANITYDCGTGTFQYTDAANASEDDAYLPLVGTAATSITASNDWSAAISVNISARTIGVSSGGSAHVVMGLVLLSASGSDGVFIFGGQWNNTGGGDDQILPHGWYGTAARFGAQLNRNPEVTTPLDGSLPSSNGSVYLPFSEGTNSTVAAESLNAVAGVLTLSYIASTKTVTAYYNGIPVGSYSLAGWGANPSLTLAVWGGSGSGVAVPAGTDTASDFQLGGSPLPTPPFVWAKRVASTQNPDDELAIGLAIDGAANLYVTGWFDGTNDFGGVTLTNAPGGGQDIFVAKYDSNGALQWARRAGGDTPPRSDRRDEGRDAGRGIGVDAAGNVYVTGGFFGTSDFGSLTLMASGNRQFFLAKYDNSGTVQWARQSVGGNGGADGVYGTAVATDGTGNSYAVGFADNGATITFGTTGLMSPYFTGYSTFLVKYDDSGEVKWAQLLNSPDQCYSTSITVDGDANVYVTGNFKTSVSIGGTSFTNAGDKDGFVAKFNDAGVLQWARQMSGPNDAGGLGVAVDASGHVYVAGGFGNTAGDTLSLEPSITLTNIGGGVPDTGIGDAFLAKYDASSGAVQWARRAGGTNLDGYTGVSTDSQGNVYVGGGTGGTGLPNGFNAILAKYDTEGNVDWTQSSTGVNGSLVFAGPVVDTDGNCYVAGWYHGTVDFGTTILQPQGYWNYFLAKLASGQPRLNVCDDFNDNLKDTNLWGSDVIIPEGYGLLTETNGRLEFTKSSGTNSALVMRPWILNYGSYTQNWEAQIDASVPQLGFPESTFGLGVTSGTNVNSNNRFSMQLFESSSETPPRFFLMRFGVEGGNFNRVAQLATPSTFAGLRIAFDASTKVLSAFYDEDGPNNGYAWTLLGSTNISTAWRMSSTDVFCVFVQGRAEADVVASADNLFGDNFCTALGPTPLTLEIAWTNGIPWLIVSGEIGNRFVLEYVSTLAASNHWQSLTTNTPLSSPTILQDANAAGNSTRFYRARLVP